MSESRASAQGGVTTALSYMRTGQYYLNKGGDYADFFPEVLELTDGRAVIDYAYHLAPMTQDGTSRRSPTWSASTASRRSRSSCSTAGTGCTAAAPTRARS